MLDIYPVSTILMSRQSIMNILTGDYSILLEYTFRVEIVEL